MPGFKLWSIDTPNVYTLAVNGYATRFDSVISAS